jgi:hypothetical protein
MRAFVALLCLLAQALLAVRAACSPHVVVLQPKPPGVEAWPQGQRALVAELSVSGLQVVLRQSRSNNVEQLMAELLDVAREPEALGALSAARQGALGLVLVVTAHSGLVRVEVPASGAIAESRAALLVAELLRSLQVPREPAAHPSATANDTSPPQPPARARLRHELWAESGVALSSDLASPLLMVGLTGSWRPWHFLTTDLGVRMTPIHMRLHTSAGAVDLRVGQASFHTSFSSPVRHGLGFTIGLGGGALVIAESAQGADGFKGRPDSTWAAILSARARGFAHAGPVVFSLIVEPGFTLPPITLRAEGNELARFGRPWTCIALGLGLQL